jgi:hypothetical protein
VKYPGVSLPGIRSGRLSIQVWQAGVFLAALIYLEAVRLINGEPFSAIGLLSRGAFIAVVLVGAWLTRFQLLETGKHRLPREALLLVGVGIAGAAMSTSLGAAWGAWLALLVLFALLVSIDDVLAEGRPWLRRWLVHLALAVAAGSTAAASAQIETRFSEEEFYVVMQALILSLLWLLLRLALHPARHQTGYVVLRRGDLPIRPARLILPLIVLALTGLAGTAAAYQNSFFSEAAPVFPGLSTNEPFICGEVQSAPGQYQAGDVQLRLLERVEANPNKGAPEYGLLALGRSDGVMAESFKHSLLEEAAQGLFTGPAHSVKYGQYEASMRVYYYTLVKEAFPQLFSQSEQQQVMEWLAAVNRRAQTVEWVDWMYALAFRYWPEGPYENQETGAGLLALLEWQGLGDPALAGSNQAYLDREARGWTAGFRNSDDAIIYQPEWINNAYFQSLYGGSAPVENLERSFEWLLLQAPPGGQSLKYNHLGYAHFAIPAYLGYQLTGDENLLWLAGRSLDYLEAEGDFLTAKPGMETTAEGVGVSPSSGSCLMYGETGVPTQTGPFGPDKIVFRDGWTEDSAYLLLNLRFTGWHRYKASNAIITAFQGRPLLDEQYSGQTLPWLPEGRSLFRDKRIPRENLNAVAVERSGLSAVLHTLTSVGGPWAQDPPFFAQIDRFGTTPEMDISVTSLADWHGWNQQRTIYFYHQGPIVIIDQAAGPIGKRAAAFWHSPSEIVQTGSRITLGSGESPAELVFLPLEDGQITSFPAGDGLTFQFTPTKTGELALVTVLLTREWFSAEVGLMDLEGETVLIISLPDRVIQVPLERYDERQ